MDHPEVVDKTITGYTYTTGLCGDRECGRIICIRRTIPLTTTRITSRRSAVRTCPFNNCDAHLPDDRFACRSHWFELSPADRVKIHAAYNDYLEDRISIDELRRLQQEVLGNRGTA